MQSFKSYLTEGITPAMLDKVDFIIRKYLKKKTSMVLFKYPGAEKFKNTKFRGFGLRYFFPKKNYSIRFNWKQINAMGFSNLESITFWNGKEPKPYEINFSYPISLIKILPILVDILKTGKITTNSFYTLPDGLSLDESYESEDSLIVESKFDVPEIFDGVLDLIQQPNFKKTQIYAYYKGIGFKIFDELEKRYPSLITKKGVKYVWAGTDKDIKIIQKDRDSILADIGSIEAKVTRGSSKETYSVDPEVDSMEQNIEKLSFQEQLKDLENLIKLTVSGASNSLFVGGRGGVGKTHTVETTLQAMGLRDGTGYFKNAGSVSAAALYALLFRYKNDILLFDDSDDVFKDQEARNVLKAATDTKRIRKLVWNKMGKNIAEPDEMTDDEILDSGLIPRYFEFTGRIIYISNLPINKLDPDGALRTRGFLIDVNPTEMEVYDFMEKIAPNMPLEDGLKLTDSDRMHVVKILRQTASKAAPANLRKLSRGLNMFAGAIAAGVEVSDNDLQRMIRVYA